MGRGVAAFHRNFCLDLYSPFTWVKEDVVVSPSCGNKQKKTINSMTVALLAEHKAAAPIDLWIV